LNGHFDQTYIIEDPLTTIDLPNINNGECQYSLSVTSTYVPVTFGTFADVGILVVEPQITLINDPHPTVDTYQVDSTAML